jgi:hypothetical protein
MADSNYEPPVFRDMASITPATAQAQRIEMLTRRLLDTLDNAEELPDEVMFAFMALDNAFTAAERAKGK